MSATPRIRRKMWSSIRVRANMAMTQSYFLIGNVMMTGVRAYNGFFTTTVAVDYLYGLGGVIIGTILGAYVFKHIPNRIFRYIVYAYICISGIIILITN